MEDNDSEVPPVDQSAVCFTGHQGVHAVIAHGAYRLALKFRLIVKLTLIWRVSSPA